jgi:hypothetical protein
MVNHVIDLRSRKSLILMATLICKGLFKYYDMTALSLKADIVNQTPQDTFRRKITIKRPLTPWCLLEYLCMLEFTQ